MRTVFLGLKELVDKKSATMYEAIKICLREHGLTITSITALGTDGTNSMVGRTNGLVGLLLRDQPRAIDMHCGCHLTALGAKDSFGPDVQFQSIEKLVNKVTSHFSFSTDIFPR